MVGPQAHARLFSGQESLGKSHGPGLVTIL